MGLLLVLSLLALAAALIALYEVSITVGLSESALTYQYNLRIADTASRLAPYSILPTLIAVAFKLWYAAVEETLKRQQPYYSMFKAPTPVSRSVLAEYTNAPLFLTSVKAVRNSHWTLALVGLGALGTEVFTVAMSALWNRQIVPKAYSFTIAQQLELRNVPSVHDVGIIDNDTKINIAVGSILDTVYGTYLTSWLYTATIELSQGASSPAWSDGTWNFVPVDLAASQSAIISALPLSLSGSNVTLNVTVETQALQARLECQRVEYIDETWRWLSEWDFNNNTIDPETNKTMWTSSNRPQGLDIGYELHAGVEIPNDGGTLSFTGPFISTLTCCPNMTGQTSSTAAIGYWSQLKDLITITWLVGAPLEGLYFDSYRDPNMNSALMIHQHWLWSDRPQLQAVQCSPIIEQANASVTVDLFTGTVRNYTIRGIPQNATSAWSDNYLIRVPALDVIYGTGLETVTASYGYIYRDALVSSSNHQYAGIVYFDQFGAEKQNLNDHTFNFRMPGMNVDFMSYAMLSMVDGDKHALLDVDTMIAKANYAFGVYFKHYVAQNLTYDQGGLAYQPIGAKLSNNLSESVKPGQGYTNSEATDLPTTKQITVHVPVEMLVMAPTAVFLCLGVLGFLIVIVVIIYGVYNNRFNILPRDVDSLASVLAFVYASQDLLDWAGDREDRNDWASKHIRKRLYARMGPFRDRNGMERWGVELQKGVASSDIPLRKLRRRPEGTA